jgi:low affinity Fe/Cu permease
MVFILQNSQNRDTKAINIKLDELLRAIEGARTGLANVGELSDEDLAKLEREFRRLASRDSPITDLQASDVSSN